VRPARAALLGGVRADRLLDARGRDARRARAEREAGELQPAEVAWPEAVEDRLDLRSVEIEMGGGVTEVVKNASSISTQAFLFFVFGRRTDRWDLTTNSDTALKRNKGADGRNMFCCGDTQWCHERRRRRWTGSKDGAIHYFRITAASFATMCNRCESGRRIGGSGFNLLEHEVVDRRVEARPELRERRVEPLDALGVRVDKPRGQRAWDRFRVSVIIHHSSFMSSLATRSVEHTPFWGPRRHTGRSRNRSIQ
jgi:hypothetical protein